MLGGYVRLWWVFQHFCTWGFGHLLSHYHVPGTVFGGLCVHVRDAGCCACVSTSVACVPGGVTTGWGQAEVRITGLCQMPAVDCVLGLPFLDRGLVSQCRPPTPEGSER